MNCPKCSARMEPVAYAGVEVDRCEDCGGLWFDLLEHEALADVVGSEKIDTGARKTARRYDDTRRIECPECRTQMIRMVDRTQPHIWYESCTACGGVFFDAGEFADYKEHTLLDSVRDLFSPARD